MLYICVPLFYFIVFLFCFLTWPKKKKEEKKKVLGNKIQTQQYELVFIFMEINIKNTICLLYFDIIPVTAFICKAVYVTCGNWGET